MRRDALEVARRAEEAGVVQGRNPFGVAAACVELTAPSTAVTQTALAEIATVSAVTVRSARDLLQTELDAV